MGFPRLSITVLAFTAEMVEAALVKALTVEQVKRESIRKRNNAEGGSKEYHSFDRQNDWKNPVPSLFILTIALRSSGGYGAPLPTSLAKVGSRSDKQTSY